MQPTSHSPLDRYRWASAKIEELKTAGGEREFTVFDIGSRDNILKQHMADSSILYKGFDLEPLGDEIRRWDIEQAFPYKDGSPQVITLLEVIEHLNNPGLCLKNLGLLLQPGGILILTTPNPKWSTARLALLSGGELTCFTSSDLELNHHVFTPWIHMVEKILLDAGFRIEEYVTLDGRTVVFDKTLFSGNALKKLGARMAKKIIEARDPSSRGMSYGIVAKKN